MNKKRLCTLVTLDFDVQLSCTDVVHLLEESFAANSILKKMDLCHFGKTALICRNVKYRRVERNGMQMFNLFLKIWHNTCSIPLEINSSRFNSSDR